MAVGKNCNAKVLVSKPSFEPRSTILLILPSKLSISSASNSEYPFIPKFYNILEIHFLVVRLKWGTFHDFHSFLLAPKRFILIGDIVILIVNINPIVYFLFHSHPRKQFQKMISYNTCLEQDVFDRPDNGKMM